MARQKPTRINFGKKEKKLPKLDLTLVQKQSWQWFIDEGIARELSEVSPIDDFTGKNWRITIAEPELGLPKISPRSCQQKGLTYSSPLKITATLINKKTNKEITQEVFLGDLPQMTSRGTFIINGVERCVINQIVRSPGIYFSGDLDVSSGRMLYKAEVRPMRGSWLEFEVSKNDIIAARIDRRRKVVASVFLRALGIDSNDEIKSLFKDVDTDAQHKYIESTLEKDPTNTKEDAFLEIYRKMRPGEPVLLENAQALFESLFFDPRRYDLSSVGRFKANKRLGLKVPNEKNNWVLDRQDIVGTIKYLIGLQNGKGRVDDIDHLANRRLRRVGELVANTAFRVGVLRLERSIKERMSLINPEEPLTIAGLINARPIMASINEFFRTSQLSTILDQTNPLSEIDNLNRLTVMGTGGISRERAAFSIRDINASQYGRICPIRSPEGPNIGLVTYLALYSKVNKFGFLEAPYRKVEHKKSGKKVSTHVTNKIDYMSADDEREHYITHSEVLNNDDQTITLDRIPARYKGEFIEVDREKVEYIDVVPRQVVGTAASLIPFVGHDEANRALMGTHMQCQAVPLLKPQSPVIGTGMEGAIVDAMQRVIRARNGGEVKYVDAQKVKIRSAYNVGAMSFCPTEIAQEIRRHIPEFTISYKPDFRQALADSWPQSVDDAYARKDWGWKHDYDLEKMTEDMLSNLQSTASKKVSELLSK